MESLHDTEKGRSNSPTPLDAHIHGVNVAAYAHLDAEKVLSKLGKYGTYQVGIELVVKVLPKNYAFALVFHSAKTFSTKISTRAD